MLKQVERDRGKAEDASVRSGEGEVRVGASSCPSLTNEDCFETLDVTPSPGSNNTLQSFFFISRPTTSKGFPPRISKGGFKNGSETRLTLQSSLNLMGRAMSERTTRERGGVGGNAPLQNVHSRKTM